MSTRTSEEEWKKTSPSLMCSLSIIWLSLCNVNCLFFLTEEYEAYMKKQEATFVTEVTAVVQEPKVGDIPPVVVTTMEQMTTTIISGQVGT